MRLRFELREWARVVVRRYNVAMRDVTEILNSVNDGDSSAREELFDRVYDDLRRIARNKLRSERNDHTLQATDLVNQCYLRLVPASEGSPSWASSRYFFAAAAHAMRRILIDYARARVAQMRGGGQKPLPLQEDEALAREYEQQIDLDEALSELARIDARKSQVVELHHFCGFSLAETAERLGLSSRTVVDDWDKARRVLKRLLSR
ncbi:MAG: ECF-type sigma factor [Planctomycetota bacterium]